MAVLKELAFLGVEGSCIFQWTPPVSSARH
jgi:hypothetical protein